MRRDTGPDLHAARRDRRRLKEREGMQVRGRSVRRLAELIARPGHTPSTAARAAVSVSKRRRRPKRRGRR